MSISTSFDARLHDQPDLEELVGRLDRIELAGPVERTAAARAAEMRRPEVRDQILGESDVLSGELGAAAR